MGSARGSMTGQLPMSAVSPGTDYSWVRGDTGFPPALKGAVMPINEMPGCRIAARPARRTRLRSAVVKSAALGVPAVALLLSAGVASAATTQQAAPAATQAVHGAHPAAAANV